MMGVFDILRNLPPYSEVRDSHDERTADIIAPCENGGCDRYVREGDDYVQVQSGIMHEGCTMRNP